MQRRGHQRRVERGATPQSDGRGDIDHTDAHLQTSSVLLADAGSPDHDQSLGRRGPTIIGPGANARRRGSDDNLHRNDESCPSPSRNGAHHISNNWRGVNLREGVRTAAWKKFLKVSLKNVFFGLLVYFYLTKLIYTGAPYNSITNEGLSALAKLSSNSFNHHGDEGLQLAMLYRDAEQKLETLHLKKKEEWKRRKELIRKKIYDKEQAKKDLEILQRKQTEEKKLNNRNNLPGASSSTALTDPSEIPSSISDSATAAKNMTNLRSQVQEEQKSANSSTQLRTGSILSRKAKRREKRESVRLVENNSTEGGSNSTRSLVADGRAKMQENLVRESMQGLLVLFCTFLFCVVMRVAANRYIDPNSLSRSRLGGREMARSIRQRQRERQRERFNNFVRRLNATRTANGERPISTESLRLVISDRNFTGDDYESLLQFNEENGHALESILHHSMGATDREIERCPAHVIQSENDFLLQSPSNPALPPKGCSVCLEAYQMNDEVRTIPCFHTFHTRCIDPWLRQKAECPICKHSAIG